MQAQVLTQPRQVEEHPLQRVDRPLPEPGPDEVLIKVRACGVCHTDLHIVEGQIPLPRLPLVPGHQVIGVVESGSAPLLPGTRVGVGWLNRTCGTCPFCRSGKENLCAEARFTGYHVDGGFASYLTAPREFLYTLPELFSDLEAAPLLCAGIIGYRALRLCGALSGERLALFGFGASAHLTLQIARHRGLEVYVFTRSPARRRQALELGAAWAGEAGETAPALADRAILFAPAGHLIPQALRALRRGGTLAIAVIYLDQVPRFDYRLLFEERCIRSVTASTRQDGRDLLQAASEVPVRVQTEPFTFGEANRALSLMKTGDLQGAAVLIF